MLLKMIVKSLMAKKIRTALTLFSIVIGVMSVLLIDSVSASGTEAISGELSSMGIDCISIMSVNDDDIFLSNRDMDEIRTIDGVKSVYSIYSEAGFMETADKQDTLIYWGISDAENHLLSVEMQEGRFLNGEDVANGDNVCVIGKDTALALFGSTDVIGKTVQARFGMLKTDYTIVGVCGLTGGILTEVANSFIPEIVYVPAASMQNLFDCDKVTQISVTLDDMSEQNVNDTMLTIRRMMAEHYREGDIKIDNFTENKNGILRVLKLVKLLLTAVAGISVIVASIGITNILFVSVSERKREIGIKKAIGATRLQIGSEFFFEGVLLCGLGCLIGILLSSWAGNILSDALGLFTVKISKATCSIAFAVSLILGALFSVIPSLKAASQKPVNCLKIE